LPRAADPLTPTEVDQLWESGQLGTGNPESLLQTLWWVNTTQFGIRAGPKEHLRLCLGDLELKSTADGHEYIERCTERQTKTRTGADPKNTRVSNPCAFATGDERCPVALHKLHILHRPTDICKPEDPFYLGTIHNPKPDQKWFRRQQLGPNKLGGFMTKNGRAVGTGRIEKKSDQF
jgi:hypothetical protein